MTLRAALEQGSRILDEAATPAARLTAEVLLCHALRCERTYLYAHDGDELNEHAWIHYGRYLDERLHGKPTQYITHRQEFYGRDFYVNESVLIPRPETEHLVEAAVNRIRKEPTYNILDVGTGSGAIAISVALETNGKVFASDISLAALKVAERNRAKHGAAVRFFAGDLLDGVATASLDLLLSNPPYVPGSDVANMQREVRDWEPQIALFAGETGFEIYRRLIAGAERTVRSGGRLILELGYQSLDGVREMLAPHWTDLEVVTDLAGLPRVLSAELR